MLNIFDTFVVPGVDYVTIYHDDQDEHLFYMLPEYPSIMRAGDGGPMFSLIVFTETVAPPKDAGGQLPPGDQEGGVVSMATELRVSDADQATIRNYIQSSYQGVRPVYQANGTVQFVPFTGVSAPVNLTYPFWVDGKVNFNLLPAGDDTFVKAQAGSDKPSLNATNIANYSALLRQAGETMVRDMAARGETPGSVNYSVSFVARIPSLTIHVTGKMDDTYEQIRHYCAPFYLRSRSYWLFPMEQMDSLQTVRTIMPTLNIEVSYGDWQSSTPDSLTQDVEKKLNDMVLTVLQDFLKSRFFGATFSPDLQSGAAGGADSGAVPGGNQNWLRALPDQELHSSIDFRVDYRSNIVITRNPNRLLLEMLTAEEITKRIIPANLTNPYFAFLTVSVRVTADFANDPIAAIIVHLQYDQIDDATGERRRGSGEYTFMTGQELGYFPGAQDQPVLMAKDKDGNPKDTYTYWSEIYYKASEAQEETPHRQTSSRQLILGYDQLNAVRVQATWGAVPTDVVQRVQIHFQYPGLNSPTAQKDIFLTPAHATDSWFTYTGNNAGAAYQYQISYFLGDEQRLDLPVQTAQSNSLVVNTPFVDMLRVTFVPEADFSKTTSIVVSTRYADQARGYSSAQAHTFTSAGNPWLWEVHLLDRAQRGFAYKVDVTSNDGTADEGAWVTDGQEGTILVGKVVHDIVKVSVVPALLDMQKTWKLVIVQLRYADPANAISQDQIIQITPTNAGQTQTWQVPIKNSALKKYTYQVEAFGYDNSHKVVGPTESDNGLLVLQL